LPNPQALRDCHAAQRDNDHLESLREKLGEDTLAWSDRVAQQADGPDVELLRGMEEVWSSGRALDGLEDVSAEARESTDLWAGFSRAAAEFFLNSPPENFLAPAVPGTRWVHQGMWSAWPFSFAIQLATLRESPGATISLPPRAGNERQNPKDFRVLAKSLVRCCHQRTGRSRSCGHQRAERGEGGACRVGGALARADRGIPSGQPATLRPRERLRYAAGAAL
jgi:hypothetical protein